MKNLMLAFTLLAPSLALADVKLDCDAKAVGKNGKPLSGAAKNSFVKKCLDDSGATCEEKAFDKNGKALGGAARVSFVKKCESDDAASRGTPGAKTESTAK